MFVACTIVLTIAIANILIAYTIEAAEELKLKAGFIQSEQKVVDIITHTDSPLLKCFIKTFALEKVRK